MNLLPCPRSLKILRGTFTLPKQKPLAAIKVVRTHSAPNHPEGYALTISKTGIEISFRETGGLRAAKEIKILDARCRELGIDLVPNQNSFGHLRYFLADPRLKKLGELSEPYEAETKDFLLRPTTLAPNHPGTLPFLRGLYDELLPNFSSGFFNVGGDETWDLGRGQSKKLCEAKGKGRVYFDFLKKIHREVAARDKKMMFWGDIILKYPKLISELAKFGGADLRVSQNASSRVRADRQVSPTISVI